ncbi:MAG: RHS repeat-associated core domain-containing protein [Chloroflexota bacterium]
MRDGDTLRDDAALRSEETLHYIYTDHLGSANTLVDQSGSQTNSRFMPFGEIRSGGSELGDLTERGFTGHRENREIGLTYMNARYYVPGIGRFASADTIVPDLKDPQSYNRYSYVQNSPVLFNDPTGHCAESGDDSCWSEAERLSLQSGIDLKYFSRLSFNQLTGNRELAAVLAFTLYQKDLVDAGQITDADALVSILKFGIEDVSGGDVSQGMRYVSSIFWRHEFEGLVIDGYAYEDLSASFLDSGFDPLFLENERNQLEHFISEAFLSTFLYPNDPYLDIAEGGAIDLGSLIPFAQEARQWLNPNDAGGAWTNINFGPDLLLGYAATNFIDVLEVAQTPAQKERAYNALHESLTNQTP